MQNFRNMYDMIEEKLITAKLAQRLDRPMWMTKEGTLLADHQNQTAYGCKVALEVTHPEMIILADEVGCNKHLRPFQ